MDETAAKKLREKFPENAIGKLPRITCRDCSEKVNGRTRGECGKHQKAECAICHNWMTVAHIHLDFVGHAATTDRLLSVDPDWTWEPMAFGANGEPLMTNGGMWIWLTVCGVRRPGFGDGPTPKEIIGDAIRNAAMRFGVALDLWAKEDLHSEGEAEPREDAGPSGPGTTIRESVMGDDFISKDQRKRLWTIARVNDVPEDVCRRIILELAGVESSKEITRGTYDAVVEALEAWPLHPSVAGIPSKNPEQMGPWG